MDYRKKERFQAEKLTEELAIDCFLNKKQTPLGFNIGGSFHPETKKVFSADIFVPTFGGGRWAYLGDWIVVSNNGEKEVYSNDRFNEAFEEAPTQETNTEKGEIIKLLQNELARTVAYKDADIKRLEVELLDVLLELSKKCTYMNSTDACKICVATNCDLLIRIKELQSKMKINQNSI